MKLSASKIDPEVVEKGEWVKNIPEFEDLELLVRGLGNSEYRKRQQTKFQLLPRGVRAQLPPEISERIQNELLIETCLLGWKNLLDDEEKPIPFSAEKANELMTDPQYRAFRDAVAWAASLVGSQHAAAKVDTEKN